MSASKGVETRQHIAVSQLLSGAAYKVGVVHEAELAANPGEEVPRARRVAHHEHVVLGQAREDGVLELGLA